MRDSGGGGRALSAVLGSSPSTSGMRNTLLCGTSGVEGGPGLPQNATHGATPGPRVATTPRHTRTQGARPHTSTPTLAHTCPRQRDSRELKRGRDPSDHLGTNEQKVAEPEREYYSVVKRNGLPPMPRLEGSSET